MLKPETIQAVQYLLGRYAESGDTTARQVRDLVAKETAITIHPEHNTDDPNTLSKRARLVRAVQLNGQNIQALLATNGHAASDLALAHALFETLGEARNRLWPDRHDSWIVFHPNGDCPHYNDFIIAATRLAELYPKGIIDRNAPILPKLTDYPSTRPSDGTLHADTPEGTPLPLTPSPPAQPTNQTDPQEQRSSRKSIADEISQTLGNQDPTQR